MSNKFRPIINSLAAGELGPEMYGRTDHEKYASGLAVCKNFISKPHGSVYRRPGTRHILEAKNADKKARLFGFDFNSTVSQSYILEFGDHYIRFFMDAGVILNASNAIYEIASPWDADQVQKLSCWQAADVMYLAHGNVSPRKLVRKGHADWTLEEIDFRISGYALAITDANNDGAANGKQGDSIVIPKGAVFESKSIVKGVNLAGAVRWFEYHGDSIYDATDAEMTISFYNTPDGKAESLQIVSVYNGSQVLSEDWVVLESDNSAPKEWTGTNWPSLVGCYENRLAFAATPSDPTKFWLSRTGYYTDFRINTADDGEPLDDDAIWDLVSGSRMAPIHWMCDQDALFMGTASSEVRVWSGTDGEPLTPDACQKPRISANGSNTVPGQLVNSSVVYVSPTGRKLFKLAFKVTSYKYDSDEITLYAPHITGPGVVDMAYALEPDGVLWCVRSDGVLAACTYLPEQVVVGWHRHFLGGDGVVESIAAIPATEGSELWMIVKRLNTDGSVRRDVERMEPVFRAMKADGSTKSDASDSFFVDSGLSYSGDAKTVFTGLGHLEGKTVQILADGVVLEPQTVASGSITLSKAASSVVVGLAYESLLQTLPLDIPLQTGSTQAQKKRVTGATFHVQNTIGGAVAVVTEDGTHWEDLLRDVSEVVPGTPPSLYSGYRDVTFSAGSTRDAVLAIRQTDPLPLTVAYLIPEVVLG
jgi:hypothetical protein